MNHQESKNKNRNGDNENVRRNPLLDLPEWLEEFTENLVDESVPGHRDAPASSCCESGSEPRVRVVSGSGKHSIYTYFPKDKDCDICKRTKITRAPFRKRTGTVVPRAEKFGDLITADQKTSQWRMWTSKQSSIRCRGTRLGNSVDPILSVQNKNSSGNGKGLTKVLGADEETKTHLHRQLPRIWQSLWRPILVSLYVDTSPFRDKWCCWKSGKYAELVKGPLHHCCNQVWMTNGGRIPWSVTATWGTYEISCLLGRHLTRGDSENHSKDQEFHLVQWSNITLFLPKTCRDCISSARKSYQVYSSAHVLYAGGIWKGDTVVADIEELENMDASEIHAERLNA